MLDARCISSPGGHGKSVKDLGANDSRVGDGGVIQVALIARTAELDVAPPKVLQKAVVAGGTTRASSEDDNTSAAPATGRLDSGRCPTNCRAPP